MLLKNSDGLKRYSLDKILQIMETLKCYQDYDGKLILTPITKEMIRIFNEFNIPVPDFKIYFDKYFFKKEPKIKK
jgi:hypothetical protein